MGDVGAVDAFGGAWDSGVRDSGVRDSGVRDSGVGDSGSAAIEVRGLRVRYGDLEAVAGIDLTVRRGEVFAFLGPNGAGKTTTVEVMEGYRTRQDGVVRVLGVDPATAGPDWRARIGVVLQESEPERELTVRECLELYAGYYPAPRPVAEVLDLVGLAGRAGARTGRLSGGQRRRLDVALALIGDPELVFLDEPTTGFDPSARRAAWDMVEGLRDLGTTVFLTTHYMDEAERLADRIAVIAAGRVVAEGTAATLGGRDRVRSEITFTLPAGVDPSSLPAGLSGSSVPGSVEGRVRIETVRPLADMVALSGWAAGHAGELPDLELRRPSLEDVYLRLTADGGADRD